MHQSTAREEQTGSYEIDPEIRKDARRLLGLDVSVQNVSSRRLSLDESKVDPKSVSEERLGCFLRTASRETINHALDIFGKEIHFGSDEEATAELHTRLDGLKGINYPVGDYEGLQSFQLYGHFVCLRGELTRRYQHRR